MENNLVELKYDRVNEYFERDSRRNIQIIMKKIKQKAIVL